ncbi:MAG: YlxR family protein [Propionibacteriaceae bacterium]|nr:YlxR family protein [Propionibacteriaceae bacterium]
MARLRMCLGCRGRSGPDQLIRLVFDRRQSQVVVDQRRRLPGRGAWLHPNPDCLERARRRQALSRALRLTPGEAGDSWPTGLECLFTHDRADPIFDPADLRQSL